MRSLYLLPLSAVALLLPEPPVIGLCPQVKPVAICAMCSQNNAAVRWTVESGSFVFFELRYVCSYPNGTVVVTEDSPTEDNCFKARPITKDSDPRTGVSSVGHELGTGVECVFLVEYRKPGNTVTNTSSCTIQSPETCATQPDNCQVDRISVMNEEEQCPEYHCAAGYSGDLCNNVNECETNNTCHELSDCHDTDGSYLCVCRAGLMGDGYNCTDIDECVNETCGENAHCVNTVGTFSCQCDEGFTGDGYNCSDRNECELDSRCDRDAECVNTVGSYQCTCNTGYTGDGHTCSDVNECETNNTCHEHADCHDTDGSYLCECRAGFMGDGYNCTDIDECENETCGENAQCVNTVGTFSCQCDEGFTGDGYNCSDRNECELDRCDRDAECVNTVGSYQCTCNTGYTGDGHTCSDIDECEGLHDCHHNTTCANLPGTYQCDCLDGFFMNGDNDCITVKSPTDSSINLAAVVSAGVFGAVLLILILTIALIVVYFCIEYLKTESPSFQELTKMDLDPDYTPSFWRGSLASVHSKYEKLDFSDLTDLAGDITNLDDSKHRGNVQDDRASINTFDQVNAPVSPTVLSSTQGEPLTQMHAADYHPLEEHNGVQNKECFSTLTTTCTNPSDAQVAIDIDAISISDMVASLGGDGTIPNIEGDVTDTKTPSETVLYTGYVAGNGATSILIEDEPKLKTMPGHQHHATGCASSGHITNTEQQHPAESQQRVYPVKGHGSSCEDSISELQAPFDHTGKDRSRLRMDYVADSSTCSSGYITAESITSGALSNEPEACNRWETCSSDTLDQDDQFSDKSSLHYVAKGVSSGYASESMTGDSEYAFRCRPYGTTEQGSQHSEHHPSTQDTIISRYVNGKFPLPTAMQTTCMPKSSSCGKEQKLSDNYNPRASSSSYGTESASWKPHTSLGSDGTENTTIYPSELGEADLDSVKFTVNAHQQSEYVNAVEETFFTNVCFDIAP